MACGRSAQSINILYLTTLKKKNRDLKLQDGSTKNTEMVEKRAENNK